MTSNGLMTKRLLISVLAMACLGLAGLAAQQTGASVAQDKPVTLAYKFPEGKALAYRTSGNETQNMDVMGQSISTLSRNSLEFSLKPKGLKDNNFTLGVTIDAFKISVESPQGTTSPDPATVNGKTFDMVLSGLGKISDVSGASSIQYNMGETGKRNIAAGFQAFFPDLPDHPVKTGDTWQSDTTIVDKSDTSEIKIALKNEHKLDGFETVDGYECARVKATAKGTLAGVIEQGGMTLNLEGTIQGTQTWYFAIKEGIYVKGDEKSSTAGTVTAGSPANLTIPITAESQGETRLLKK